jgi:hypothetical protein
MRDGLAIGLDNSTGGASLNGNLAENLLSSHCDALCC